MGVGRAEPAGGGSRPPPGPRPPRITHGSGHSAFRPHAPWSSAVAAPRQQLRGGPFPIPVLVAIPPEPGCGGGHSRRFRCKRRRDFALRARDALRALNALYASTAGGLALEFLAGGWNADGVSHRCRPVIHLTAAQNSIVERVVRRVTRAGACPDEVPLQGALLTMLRMKDLYDAEPALL